MSGVLKDILLVVASMVIFRDPVTAQQFFGYSIALAGLVYYRLGAEKMQSLAKDVRLQLGNFRHQNPARTKILANVAILAIVVFGLLMWGPDFLGQSEASQKL